MPRHQSKPLAILDSMQYLTQQEYPNLKHPYQANDFNLIKTFLLQYTGSQDTFNAYRRESERLLQWSWFISKKSILKLTRQDINDYILFCQNPPDSWIGDKVVSRFRTIQGLRIANPEWRLFVALKSNHSLKDDKKQFHLSQKALQSLFIGTSTLYKHLIREGHCEVNPVALIRQKSQYLRKKQVKRQIRRLTSTQWEYIVSTAESMANENPNKHERTLFIMSALYLLYLRVSELAASNRWIPTMGDFYCDSNGFWWFKTVGKGNKERDITVSEAMLDALKRYRHWRELSPNLPIPGEEEPLITKLLGSGPVTSTRQIRLCVQACFDKTINQLKQQGYQDDAQSLQQATVHWLRHTGISDDINKRGRPIAHVRDDAGHASSATTDLYNDAELKARHASAQGKSLIPDAEKNT